MRVSWVDGFVGKVYHESDRRLVGRGTPPTCPLPDGMGQMGMQPKMTKDDGTEEESGYREFPNTTVPSPTTGVTPQRKPPEGYNPDGSDQAKVNPLTWKTP